MDEVVPANERRDSERIERGKEMKEHFCPAEQSMIAFEKQCNWCGERETLAQTQEPVAWPCLIDSADFSKGTVTIVMQCDNYKVSAGKHWLSPTPPQKNT